MPVRIVRFFVKGQLISKRNSQAEDSPKKRTNEFVFTSMRRVFVRFLGKSSARKKSFWDYLTFKYYSHYCHCREQLLGVAFFCLLCMFNPRFLRSFRISSRFSSRCTPLSSDVFWVFLANTIVAILSSVFEPNDDKYNNDYKTPYIIKQNFWESLIPWLS